MIDKEKSNNLTEEISDQQSDMSALNATPELTLTVVDPFTGGLI